MIVVCMPRNPGLGQGAEARTIVFVGQFAARNGRQTSDKLTRIHMRSPGAPASVICYSACQVPFVCLFLNHFTDRSKAGPCAA